VDHITSRSKSLVLELKFITLRIEGFDLDRRFQEFKFMTLRIEGFDLDR
jgi:hypothetical protein